MRKLLILVIVGALGLYGYRHHRAEASRAPHESVSAFETDPVEMPATPSEPDGKFRCDGRQYCSQMTFCGEATWHLQHCPGMKMDGDQDGVPCEKQWCPGG